MSWTAPMTAVANSIWAAADYNTFVRDNLLVSEAAITATAGGMLFASTTANSLVERMITSVAVTTGETTASTAYIGLTTPVAITITTGANALVYCGGQVANNATNSYSVISYAVSGATSSSAIDDYAFYNDGLTANNPMRGGLWHMRTGLTPGSNTFTQQYRVQSGTGTFSNRELIVLPL